MTQCLKDQRDQQDVAKTALVSPVWQTTSLIHSLEKPMGQTGECCPQGVPRPKTRGTTGPEGFWPWNLPRDNIHHATPKVFSKNTILNSSRTSKQDSLQANLAPGEYTPQALTNIDSVKSPLRPLRGPSIFSLGTPLSPLGNLHRGSIHDDTPSTFHRLSLSFYIPDQYIEI